MRALSLCDLCHGIIDHPKRNSILKKLNPRRGICPISRQNASWKGPSRKCVNRAGKQAFLQGSAGDFASETTVCWLCEATDPVAAPAIQELAPKPPPSQAKLHSLPDRITSVAPTCGSLHVNV